MSAILWVIVLIGIVIIGVASLIYFMPIYSERGEEIKRGMRWK